jgi:hypothetical protein
MSFGGCASRGRDRWLSPALAFDVNARVRALILRTRGTCAAARVVLLPFQRYIVLLASSTV